MAETRRDAVIVGGCFAGLRCARDQQARSLAPLLLEAREAVGEAPPGQTAPALSRAARPVCLGRRLFVCGDHRHTASIQGAMVSGRRAALALVEGAGANA